MEERSRLRRLGLLAATVGAQEGPWTIGSEDRGGGGGGNYRVVPLNPTGKPQSPESSKPCSTIWV